MAVRNPENQLKKRLRSIGHRLKPVVTVAQKGLTESVCNEINRALDDHELIKVSVKCADREERRQLIDTICQQCPAELVQTIGHIALLYRPAKSPDPRLSNLLR